MLYLLFKHGMPAARELFEATFYDYCAGLTSETFKGDAIHLLDLRGWRQGWFDRKAPNLVDTTMARALGFLLQQKNLARYQTEEGVQWDHIGSSQAYILEKWNEGNVPLRTNTLAYVLESILGFSVKAIAFRDDYTLATKEKYMGTPLAANVQYAPYNTVPEFLALYRQHAADATSYVLAGLKALEFVQSKQHGDAQDSQLADFSRDKQNKQNPKALKRRGTLTDTTRAFGSDPYDHWVVIEDVVSAPGDKVALTLWTWGRQLSLRLSGESFLHTVHDVIFGTTK